MQLKSPESPPWQAAKVAAKLLEDDRRPIETAAYAEDGNRLLGDVFLWLRPSKVNAKQWKESLKKIRTTLMEDRNVPSDKTSSRRGDKM